MMSVHDMMCGVGVCVCSVAKDIPEGRGRAGNSILPALLRKSCRAGAYRYVANLCVAPAKSISLCACPQHSM